MVYWIEAPREAATLLQAKHAKQQCRWR